ncbi:MAG: NAD(+) diphosphatase [Oscillospiraceae bacterium]|nr:NAD(+) diphosphatase [Oscillospiraceae bacterium]
MLQDMAFGRLENEYRNMTAGAEDRVLCFHQGQVLLCRGEDDTLTLPTLSHMAQWQAPSSPRYLFRMLEEPYFLWIDPAPLCPDGGFAYEPVRPLRQLKSKEICYAIMTGWHLYNWYRTNRLCGCCGTPTEHDQRERMLRCPGCGNMIFPRISPAVIVAVTNGDRLLLSKYAGRAYTRYALLAGYTEIGETMEQTVHREVMEEVGLRVKNLRYYKSQPWGVDGNVLMGFFCDVDGSDAIHIDEQELAMADWYPRDALPAQDDGISLTREMIRIFGEGKEPK